MLRGILIIVLVVCLGVGGWALWKQYNGGSAFGSGDVAARDAPAEKDKSDAAYTDLDGNQTKEAQTTGYDRNAAPAEGASGATNQAADSRKAAASGTVTEASSPAAVPQNQTSSASVTGGAAPAALPVSDTIAANPPNGAVFAGTGKFQWYRQGNITWRVNSGNGTTCIAFATMEEWQKQIVYSHGCGNA